MISVHSRIVLAGCCLALFIERNTRADLERFAYPGDSLTNADIRFVSDGDHQEDYAGCAVSSAGDIDGDGRDDILVGAYHYNYEDASLGDRVYPGGVFLFLAKSIKNSFGEINLSDADYTFTGENDGDLFGISVAPAGDIDGDGSGDLVMGASDNDDNGENSGKIYLFLGSSVLTSAPEITASDADTVFVGIQESAMAGCCVSSADVDGDGLSDLLIGAYGSDFLGTELCGKTFLFLGATIATSSASSVDISTADYIFFGEDEYDFSGYSVATANVDGDVYGDILIGALGGDKAYLVLGKTLISSGKNKYDLSAADYTFVGENSGDSFGGALCSAGDVNDDGYDEILIGARFNDDGGPSAGKAYLFSGQSILSSASAYVNASNADWSFIGEGRSHAGFSVARAGNVDGDELSDLLIGATFGNGDDGKSYLLLGSNIVASTSIHLTGADYIFNGTKNDDQTGYCVNRAGDVNGDGLDDILIGQFGENTQTSSCYFIYSDEDCIPTDTIYVDGVNGSADGLGGEDCPLDTIQAGIDQAHSLGITNVVVMDGTYKETVTLKDGIAVVGQAHKKKNTTLYPTILDTNGVDYVVEGANRATMKYFFIQGGGILLDGVNDMVVKENAIYVSQNSPGAAVMLSGGARGNRFENNLMYSMSAGATQVVAYIEQNGENNQFINNVMHRLYYSAHISRGFQCSVVKMEEYTYDNEFRNNILHSTLASNSAGTNGAVYSGWYGFDADSLLYTSYTIEYNKTGKKNNNVTLGTGCAANNYTSFVKPYPEGNDYSLLLLSPCRNAGDPDAVCNDPDGTRNDMGVYGGPNSLDFEP